MVTNGKVYKVVFYLSLYYKMKQKLSITIEEETIKLLEEIIKEGRFRNKSHFVEYSINKVLKENKDGFWIKNLQK